MLFVLLGVIGWPVTAFLWSRISRRRPALIAVRAATFTLFASLLVGIPLADSWLMLRQTRPTENSTMVIFAFVVVWVCAPYVGMCIWLVRHLFFPSAANTRHT
jgi:hypothetical protein